MDKPLTSELLPVSFAYPAIRIRGDISRFEFPDASNPLCIRSGEVIYWAYKDVLRQAGAPDEVINLELSSDPVEQQKQGAVNRQRTAYLDRVLGGVVRDFYVQVNRTGIALTGTSTQPVPNGSTVVRTTFGGNDTIGTITYKGNGYLSFFKEYAFLGSLYPDVFALTLCQVSGAVR